MASDVPELDFSAASSSSSHGASDGPVTPGTATVTPRRSNKLRKQRGGSPFSFVADSPPTFAHFPYTFSAPASPTSTLRYASTVTSATPLIRQEAHPKRTASMPSRKLTKQKPAPSSYVPVPAKDEVGVKRRSTLSFNFRRRKSERALPPSPVAQAEPPPLPPRQSKFTIGGDDSDEEDLNADQPFPQSASPTQTVWPELDESSTSPIRPPLLRREADMGHLDLSRRHSGDFDDLEIRRRRRWTLMTDEHITDEDFADTVFTRTQCVSCDGHPYEEYTYDDLGLLRLPAIDNDSVKRSTLLALLTTRDLLRTERHYLSQLHNMMQTTLATGQWPSYPSPALMHDHLLTLIASSQNLLRELEADPSVSGVASVFIRLEGDLGHALGSWCGVVGGWFDEERRRKLTRRSVSSKTISLSSPPSTYFPPTPLTPIRASTEPPTSPTNLTSRPKSIWRKSWTAMPSFATPPQPPAPKHSIRDLGILPVQRVTRYVLFFRDVLKHTDFSSPSRDVVEGAVRASVRIAQRCDEAQTHKRFSRV